MKRILVLNPGSTSTKLALYEDEEMVWQDSIDHNYEEINKYNSIYEQEEMRKSVILRSLEDHDTKISSLDSIVGRGGPAMPFKSGAYRLNEDLVDVLYSRPENQHISLLGGILAYNLAQKVAIPSYIYDAVSVDEFEDVTRVSGLDGIERKSAGHYLNLKAVSRKVAKQTNKNINDVNYILAHLGGGISVSILKHGKMVDMINDYEGPFSPERSGGLPVFDLVDLCYKNDKATVKKMLRGNGGLVSYLGTTDLRIIENMIKDGDEKAELIFDAMVYQISKSIASLTAVVRGKVDGVILTGGMAFSDRLVDKISENIDFIAKVYVIPGENELESLALGTLRVLMGEEEANVYKK